MRRKPCEIKDPEKIESILLSATIGRICTNGEDGYPYITPVNFAYFNNKIYFHSVLKGEKLDNINKDPNICFEVDIPLAYLDSKYYTNRSVSGLHQFYQCVIIRGKAKIITEEALKVDALNALVEKHEMDNDFERVRADMPAVKACHVIEITPENITAKSDLFQTQTLEGRLSVVKYLKQRNWPLDLETIRAFGFDPDEV